MKSLWFTTTSIVFWVIFIIQLFLSMNFRDPPACFIFSICYINATLTKYLKYFLLWSVWLHTCICHYIFRNEVEENEALQVSSKRFSIFLSWSMLAEANWIVVTMIIIIQKKACFHHYYCLSSTCLFKSYSWNCNLRKEIIFEDLLHNNGVLIGSVTKRPTDNTTSTASGKTDTTSATGRQTNGQTSATTNEYCEWPNEYYKWTNEYYEWVNEYYEWPSEHYE